jgi:hypothetical protein
LFVLDIQAVTNTQFNMLVFFFTFPEKGLSFEPAPTRKDEKAGGSVEDIWPRKTENRVMFTCVLN